MDRLPHDRDLGRSILGSRGGLTLCDVLQSSVEVELLMERGGFGNLSADRQRAVKERTMGCKWSFQCHTTSNRGLSRVLCVACQQMRSDLSPLTWCPRTICAFLLRYGIPNRQSFKLQYTAHDIGLAQPGLPGGAFGASLQGPGREVVGRTGLTSYRVARDHVCKYSLTGGTG